MDIAKLFRVVVVGGALLTAGSCSDKDEDTQDPQDPALANLPDAAPDVPDAEAAPRVDAATEELEDCGFCPNEICCEIDTDGNSTLRDGFECCWTTSC